MTTVVNIRRDPYDVLIMRPSKWGNPFEITDKCPRALAIAKYEVHIRRSPDLIAALPELAGKRLGCICHPLPCHGDILVKLLQETTMSYGTAKLIEFAYAYGGDPEYTAKQLGLSEADRQRLLDAWNDLNKPTARHYDATRKT